MYIMLLDIIYEWLNDSYNIDKRKQDVLIFATWFINNQLNNVILI